MPLYEYHCSKCSKTIEIIQKFTDPALSECPECQSKEIKKLLSKTSFQLKGTGWYATDYKSSKKSEPSKESAPSKPEGKKVESPKAPAAKKE